MLLDTVSAQENEKAKEFVKAHLSPATYSDNSTVKFPDGTFGETLAYSKTFSIDVKPGAGGDLFVYILPFVEVPLATWTSAGGWNFYYDPNMARTSTSRSWMADHGIEAYRCLGQSCTAYNTTAEIYKQGNVNAAVVRSCIDRHRRYYCRTVGSGPYVQHESVDAVLIDGLPMTIPAVTSNSKHPYIGEASRGCYVVNRNFAGFRWIFRNGRDKSSVTEAYMSGGDSANSTTFISVPTFPRSPDDQLVITGTNNFQYPLAELTTTGQYKPGAFRWGDMHTMASGLGVSGFNGNGYGVGVMGFTGLSEQSSFTLKFKHMYEFMLKPGSPFTPLTTPSWPRVDWVEEIIRKQLVDKQEAFDSSANFLGAILRGLQAIWPVVRPLVVTGATKLIEWVDGKARKKKTQPPPPKTKPKLQKK